jgi:AcrR family transcriptional regulator
MARKDRRTPKRKAKQERAQATVEAILKAAAYVLVESGYEKTNTNRIAEVAGVNIGSLYQYFSNKEEIIAELIERQLQLTMKAFAERLESVTEIDPKVGARLLIRAIIAARKVDPRLRKVFDDQIPKSGKLNRLREFELQSAEMLARFLDARKPELRIKDPDLAAFLIVHLVNGLLRVMPGYPPGKISDARLEDELTDIVLRYLLP